MVQSWFVRLLACCAMVSCYSLTDFFITYSICIVQESKNSNLPAQCRVVFPMSRDDQDDHPARLFSPPSSARCWWYRVAVMPLCSRPDVVTSLHFDLAPHTFLNQHSIVLWNINIPNILPINHCLTFKHSRVLASAHISSCTPFTNNRFVLCLNSVRIVPNIVNL